jgi:hypothetical protein
VALLLQGGKTAAEMLLEGTRGDHIVIGNDWRHTTHEVAEKAWESRLGMGFDVGLPHALLLNGGGSDGSSQKVDTCKKAGAPPLVRSVFCMPALRKYLSLMHLGSTSCIVFTFPIIQIRRRVAPLASVYKALV